MIDHVSIAVSDYERSKAFYLAALAPLGYELFAEFDRTVKVCGLGAGGKPDFWLTTTSAEIVPIHLAFGAASREQVDAFYEAALGAGARDNGAPGPRPQYHPGYYGAFVLDPDGYNIEAVVHNHRP